MINLSTIPMLLRLRAAIQLDVWSVSTKRCSSATTSGAQSSCGCKWLWAAADGTESTGWTSCLAITTILVSVGAHAFLERWSMVMAGTS